MATLAARCAGSGRCGACIASAFLAQADSPPSPPSAHASTADAYAIDSYQHAEMAGRDNQPACIDQLAEARKLCGQLSDEPRVKAG